MSQKEMVLEYMRAHGGITAREAAEELGIQRLAARIWELRDAGHTITNEQEKCVNRHGKVVRYDRYKVVEDDE